MQKKARLQGQQLEGLEEALESEQQASDILRARNYALESDSAELMAMRLLPHRREWSCQAQGPSLITTQPVTSRGEQIPRRTSPPTRQSSHSARRTSSSSAAPDP